MLVVRFTLFITAIVCAVQLTLATDITLTAQKINNYRYPGTTATLRISYSSTFKDNNGRVILGEGFYQGVSCSVDPATKVLVIPAVTLASTEDSTLPDVKATAVLVDENLTPREVLFANWRIPATLGNTITMAQLGLYNLENAVFALPQLYYKLDSVASLEGSRHGKPPSASAGNDPVDTTKLPALGVELPYRKAGHAYGASSVPPPPMVPWGLVARQESANQISLTWTARNASGVTVERCQGEGCSDFAQIADVANVGEYDDTGLTAFATYNYRVKATNAGGESAYSNSAALTPVPPSPIDPAQLAPSVYLKASSLSLPDGAPVVTWSDSGSSGNNASSENGLRPTFRASAANGRPAIEFDGSTSRLSLSKEVPDARTIIFVVKHRTGTELDSGHTSTLLSDITASTQDFAAAGGISSPEWPSAFFYYAIAPFVPPASARVLGGRITLNGFVVNSTSGPTNAYLEKPTQYSVIAIRATGPVGFDHIGSNRKFGGTYFDGFLTDLVEWPSALTSAQIDGVTAFFKQNYGITKTQPQVIFVGDSITAGAADNNGFLSYPNKVMQQLRIDGKPADWWNFATGSQQAGEAGDTIKGPVSMQTEWAPKVSKMYDPNRSANIMVFYAGINDIVLGGRNASQVIARLTDYMAQARAVGFKVVYVTMPPDHFSVVPPPDDYDTTRATINNDMKAHPERYDAIVDTTLDSVIGCDSCPVDHASYFNDGLHLSVAGHARMATLVEPVVRSLLP